VEEQEQVQVADCVSTRMVNDSVLSNWISTGSWPVAETVRVFSVRGDWVIVSILPRGHAAGFLGIRAECQCFEVFVGVGGKAGCFRLPWAGSRSPGPPPPEPPDRRVSKAKVELASMTDRSIRPDVQDDGSGTSLPGLSCSRRVRLNCPSDLV
jgi:hypothetical protein